MDPDEQEEKARLITQVLELQNTLDGNYLVIVLHVACKLYAKYRKYGPIPSNNHDYLKNLTLIFMIYSQQIYLNVWTMFKRKT